MDGAGGPDGDGDADLAGTVTWRELLAETIDRLTGAGPVGERDAEAVRSDAGRIVAEAAGATDAELFLVLGDRATVGGVTRLDRMVARRAAGEPLQYVLGHWPFRSLDLMVDRRVLIPRPETEQVVEVALRELDRIGGRERPTTVVDLGTGSGAIALAIATERVRTAVWATDVSGDALDVARANLAGTGRAGARVRMEQGAWFAALPDELRGTVDLVVTNPPYVPDGADLPAAVADWEPAGALFAGADGLDDLRRILDDAPAWLTDDGALVCELSPEQGPVAVELALGRFVEAELAADLSGRDRALVARRPRRS
ncbi:peptide chain release factor N(5)-glutamine methyltransferase [Dermatobacter hominis]|uniref:peptide chain release factor N(5)-glutamine methyltransferase n=1 Tax=Dermatobacter hominis TaxID=2884263 RepID=UPI001D107162|nr:peptide chain release factor N(5)-glutamine methyltransferase [Dermatobacter hominis]UDY37222.1 peptide chain release factor N(5)-glutamine methyltransferase [Dermatobacter hominis]